MKNMYKMTDKFEYISFDMYDTLVNRCVSEPQIIFAWVQEVYNDRNQVMIRGFPQKRIDAEKRARMHKQTEITFFDIYKELEKDYPKSICGKCKNIETELELKCTLPGIDMKRLFYQCLNAGKKIFIVTDMYLPEDVIKKILSKCGYKGYSRLYVSSECGKTKRQGDLFSYVLKKEGIKAGRLLHIGDSVRGDYLIPKLKGVNICLAGGQRAKHIKDDLKISGRDSILKNCLMNFADKGSYDSKNIYAYLGYNCLGPLTFGYIKWLHDMFQKKGISEVFFLSREGKFIKRIFDKVFPGEFTTHYFYASRRALAAAQMWIHPEFEDIVRGIYFPREFSVRWLMQRIGLDEEEYTDVLKENGYTADDIIRRSRLADYKMIYEELKGAVENKSKKAYQAFVQYTKKFSFQDKAAFVDIGWNGNMQRCITEMFAMEKMKVRAEGFYLGMNPDTPNKGCMSGYLCDRHKNKTLYPRLKYMNVILELLFSAQHGTLIKYDINSKNGIVTDRYEYEGMNTSKIIMQMQHHAERFVEDYKEAGELLHNSGMVYAYPILNAILRPERKIVQSLGKLQVWDDMWEPLIKRRKAAEYIFNPGLLYRDFEKSSWKSGFLKSLLLVPMPFDRYLLFMEKAFICRII